MTEIAVPTLATVQGGHRLRAVLCYDPGDPLAASLVFPGLVDSRDGLPVRWMFCRHLLACGLHRYAPLVPGDVTVWPRSPWVVAVQLSSPDGVSVLELPRWDVVEFLRRSYTTVPAGREYQGWDMDRALGAWLAGAA